MKYESLQKLSKRQLIEMVKMFASEEKRTLPVFNVRKNRAVEELLLVCNGTSARSRMRF